MRGKRIFAMVLAALLAVSVVGCGKSAEEKRAESCQALEAITMDVEHARATAKAGGYGGFYGCPAGPPAPEAGLARPPRASPAKSSQLGILSLWELHLLPALAPG